MKRMKAKSSSGRGKSGVHEEDESQKLVRKRENGVHEEDESQKLVRKREKWCS